MLLLGLNANRDVYNVKDVPTAIPGYLKPSKWGWPDLDCGRLSNCIDKVIECAQSTDLFILQGNHTKHNIPRYDCCIKNIMLCCPLDGIWRPLNKQSFDDLFIDHIDDMKMNRNPDIVSVVDFDKSKPVAPEKGKLKRSIDDLDIEVREAEDKMH